MKGNYNTYRVSALNGQMESAFKGVREFGPSAFMASAVPSSILEGRVDDQRLTRSFHFHPEGCFVCIQAHGAPRAAWARGIANHLLMAGYESTWQLKDEKGFRRWLSGQRARLRELRFFEELGEVGSPPRWPKRTPTSAPIRPHTPTPKDWERVLEAVGLAEVQWNVYSIGYSHRERLVMGSGWVTLDVSAVAVHCLPSDMTVAVCSYIGNPSQEVVPKTRRKICQDLKDAGYKTRVAHGQIWGDKSVQNITGAVRESIRVFKQLLGYADC
jgi:hypothetical protein